MAEIKTWESMRTRIHGQLERQTGTGVEAWNAKIKKAKPADPSALRSWLADQGVTGYPAMLLVWETFGYPYFLSASADELVDGQYCDRLQLRPVFDALLAAVSGLGEVSVQARKTYVALVTPRRTFGVIQASTKKRVDLGLRLAGVTAGDRLLDGKGVGNDAINVRIPLEGVEDVDADVLRWLERAYAESA